MNVVPYRALVLAGRRAYDADPLVQGAIRHKAFTPLNGRAMISYVIDALEGSPHIGPISICAPADLEEEFSSAAPTADILHAKASPARSIGAALETYQSEAALIVTTSDHPLLTAQTIDQFVGRAAASGCDVAVGCVTQSVFCKAFPDIRRTFIQFSDLAFSGANLFYLRNAAASELITYWRGLEEKRKNPLAMARSIGFKIGFQYLIGRLSHDCFTNTLHSRTGARCTMIPLDAPQAAIDVDKLCDLEIAARLLSLNTA